MESIVIERLDFMSSKVREGLTVCREILVKFEEGSPGTKQDEVKANRLQKYYDSFVSEIQMFLQSRPLESTLADLKQKLKEFTTLQLETAEVLSDLEIYLSHSYSSSKSDPPHAEIGTSRLPKLDIAKFDGNVLHWHAFWDKFTSNVVSKNMSDVDRFAYLEQALEGEAARAIGGLDTTNSNYTIAVERLKERFAKPGILKDSHYVALQQIPRASSDVSECRKVLDEIERHLQVLKSLGEDTNHTGLRSTILDKFPSEVLHDLRQYTKSDDESVDDIRHHLKQVISNREDFSRREAIKTMGQASTSGFTTEAFFTKSQSQTNIAKQQNLPSSSQQRTRNSKNPKHNGNRMGRKGQNSNSGQHENGNKRSASDQQSKTSTSQVSEPPAKRSRKLCFFCGNSHFSDTCRTYPTIEARKGVLKNRCYQCFSDSHLSDQCQRKMKCRHCGVFGVHNRALCPAAAGKVAANQKDTTTVNFSHHHTGTILPTVKAMIGVSEQPYLTGRILFDTGSERSYISQTLTNRLKLKPLEHTSLTVYTFGCKRPKTINTTLVSFSVQTQTLRVPVSAYAVPTTTNDLPSYPELKKSLQESFPSLKIADDVTEASPADIIIGSDFYHQIIRTERMEIKPNLFLVNSSLGWIASGVISTPPGYQNSDRQLSFLTFVDGGYDKHKATPTPPDPPFQHDGIRGLWEIETIGITDSPKIFQDDEIVTHFNRTTIFENGRYYVKWPWVQYPPDLPVNYGLSHGRLKSLLNRIDEATLQRYNDVFQDQLDKGVIEIVQESRLPSNHPVHYLPHHCVIQEHKSTKLRVVYDASARIQGQCSLNEFLYKGPLMLEDLTTLLLAFRTHAVALTADIEKAFLQVGLQAEDRDVTRFLWLKDLTKPPTTDNLLHLRFCRVPFGMVSSPFLLAATVRLHLQRQNSPLSEHMSTCLYVDNLITGTESEEEATELYQEARNRFNELSMNIREWCSNNTNVLDKIPSEQKSQQLPTTVLGLKWNQETDQLMLSVKESLFSEQVKTKRHVSHVVASIFDPCGFVLPLTLGAKLFLQGLWVDKVKWDSPLPDDKLNEWYNHVETLKAAPQIVLSRRYWSKVDGRSDYGLHCFTDASRDAYAAAVYVRVSGDSGCSVSLVMARHRLTPIRCRDSWTIPKLELMALLIGTRLLTYVQKALAIQLSHKVVWTDSQVVLGWLKSDRLLPPFVTRRISEIKNAPCTQFRYVPSLENPADIATRCLTHVNIPNMWFHGPQFLTQQPDGWPSQYPVVGGKTPDNTNWGNDLDVTHIAATAASPIQDPPGVVLPENGTILPIETVQRLQKTFFRDEFACKPTALAKTMGLFIDSDGCLHCKGRFRYAELTTNQQYPILLPRTSRVTAQLILRIHEENHHVGVTHTLSLLRQLYWVPHGRALVKSVLATCRRCVKYGGGPYQLPCMPDLPQYRVSYSAPFTYTGLDYLGPLSVTVNGQKQKRWICLFTCMAVRAVHLEIVRDMTAEEFSLALRRFSATRGVPSLIVSDNAAQFKVVASILRSTSVEGKTIVWKFIPELSPWQGGFYERLVALVKHCLRRSLDRSLLSDSQLHTVVKEIESVLNSRPLTVVGDDLAHVLKPSDFLRPGGLPLLEPPLSQQSTSDIQTQLVLGWKRTQIMIQEFKRMFINQYLVGLRERLQFHHKQPRVVCRSNPNIGDVVLVKGDSANRAHWNVAKIKALLPSRDDLIRSARVVLPTGRELTRSICHLYPLEVSDGRMSESSASDVVAPAAPPLPASTTDGTRFPSSPLSRPEPAPPAMPVEPQPARPVDVPAPRPQRASAVQARRRIRDWVRSLFTAAIDERPLNFAS